jgi:hypothetical protein
MNDLRIGDSDRDASAKRLSDHAAAGRLDVDELERRLDRVNAAVYASELALVERVLPSPTQRRPMRLRPLPAVPLLVVACLIAAAATTVVVGHPIFPFFLVAFFLWRRVAFTRYRGTPHVAD